MKKDKLTYAELINLFTIFMFTFIQYTKNNFSVFCETYHLKYILVLIVVFFDLIMINKHYGKINSRDNDKYKYEFNNILKFIVIIFVISMALQIKNGFNSFLFSEILYLLVPLVFSLMIIKTTNKDVGQIINIIFYWYIILFFIKNYSSFTINNIKTISFENSYSPFESGLSNAFYLFEFYYLVKGDNKKAFFSMIFSFFSLKRISALFCIIQFITIPILKKSKISGVKISKKMLVCSVIAFTVITLLMNLFYQPETASYFSNKFGINLNEITLDRYDRTYFIIENIDRINQGLGSTTEFLTKYYGKTRLAARNLHNDLLRIYYECGIIGLISMIYYLFKMSQKNIYSFILMFSLLINSLFNHYFLGAGVAESWIVLCLLIYWINNES